LGAQSKYWRNVLWISRRAAGKGFQLVGLSRLALIAIPCGKSLPVPNGDKLWRRFIDSKAYWTWDDDLKRWIPNRHYLRFDPELSVFWNRHLTLHGLGPESVLDGDPRFTVVGELDVSDLRKERHVGDLYDLYFPVSHSPNDLSEIGCAHCSVYWPPTAIPEGAEIPTKDNQKRLQTEMARRFSWVHGAPPRDKPNGS
jgi:hypothetical protein